ncbi:MAG: SpoIVB peptidase [Clostridia bacterium]|nr:SpoIVB peptidase [Clostridia bacterium]
MKISLKQNKRPVIFLFLMVHVFAALILDCQLQYPGHIKIYEGESLSSPTNSAFSFDTSAGLSGVLSESGSLERDPYNQAMSRSDNGYDMTVKLFGVIPVRSVSVTVEPKKEVMACGNTVGIKIFTKGLVCVGTQEVKNIRGQVKNPAQETDIRCGDILLSAEGNILADVEQLLHLVNNCKGSPLSITIEREGKTINKQIAPVETKEGYKLGLWFRDSTAGIGTLTYYQPDNMSYGALGHPITDTDTGAIMPVSKGALLWADVCSVQKGKKGEPGELKGIFKIKKSDLGTVAKNVDCGVYGTLENTPEQALPCTVASSSQIKDGKAYILSNIKNNEVEAFDVEIEKTSPFNIGEGKDMIVHITDPDLLERTGGIVQGMSGSPILQNGRIVGAVTHVFVNDPTRGYGIFIERMLENAS